MPTVHRTDEDRRNFEVFAAVIREGFNQGNLEALDDLFAGDFVEHQRGFPTPDLDGLKRGISGLRHSIANINLENADTIVDGDKICFMLRGEGAHQGPLGPFPASGTHLTLEVIDISRFRDGKIIEHWGIPDHMSTWDRSACPNRPHG